MADDFTFSTWLNADEFSNNVLLGKGSDASMELRFTNATTFTTAFDGETAVNTTISGMATDTWIHFAFTRDKGSGETKIYVNGVLNATATILANEPTGNFDFIGYSNSNYWDGHLRDMRIYDGVILSADQISSLYSGSYNVMPYLWWKMDEGTGLPLSTGTKSISNPSDTGANGATVDAVWDNGILNLDGTLTVDATGFLSAPRGDLSLAAATTFAQSSASDTNNTFIHNNGRVVVTNAGTVEYSFSSDNDGSDNPLYDFQNQANGQVRFATGFIIENSHSRSGGNNYNYLTGGRQYNYGTTSSPAAITALLRVALSGGDNIAHVYGVSSLYPVTMDNWDDLPMSYDVSLKNINVTTNVTTNVIPSGRKVILDGDCEFDAFTVESGGTLDLNGQRAEFSGTLDVDGTLDADGQIYFTGSGTMDDDGTYSNPNLLTLVPQ